MLDIVNECREAKLIGITGHIRPDGDCVGSVFSLYQFLKAACSDAKVEVLLEQPAPIYNFIKGVSEIVKEYPDDRKYDVLFVLDSVADRIGEAGKYLHTAVKTINIDHHISNKGTCRINYIVPEASSTAELIYDLICVKESYKKLMDMEMAQTIYLGIIQDSGVMQYSNTSPKTLHIVADLISYGFDFPKLIDETFHEKTYIQSQIMGRALLEAFPIMQGKIMVSMIDQKTMNFYGAVSSDFDGIVNQLRIIKGVEVAVFMHETGTLQYKVSLRSCGNVDVSEIAAFFSGGGHVRAAGCTMSGTFHDVVNNLTEQIALQMREL